MDRIVKHAVAIKRLCHEILIKSIRTNIDFIVDTQHGLIIVDVVRNGYLKDHTISYEPCKVGLTYPV